ncbi:MAG: YlmC/YmxH family sporulation protein [Ruminococcus sp.]|nr:YlmC/YmxH family sporulation protein [Ruminococcus sp.]
MICSFSGLRNKEIVDLSSGMKIGYADDMEIDTSSSAIVSIIVYGKPRAMGLMGRDEDIIIKCSDIKLIGEDTILVSFDDAKPLKNTEYKVDNL